MSQTPPLFSIITVCYNAEGCIEPTLDSVDAQTCHLYEHLIIDGASKDGTLQIVARHDNPLRRVESERDRGIYDAMNKGLGMARGEYVIFLNAGDAFHSPNVLQALADAAMNHDFPGVLYGNTVLVDAERRVLGNRHLTPPERLDSKSFAQGMLVCHQAFVPLRRITAPYDLRYRLSADYDWCIRCLQHSRHNCFVNQVLIDYLYEGASTANRRRSLLERFRIMCHYYGTVPTVLRHLGFIPRFINDRIRMSRSTKSN